MRGRLVSQSLADDEEETQRRLLASIPLRPDVEQINMGD